jgi:hypothetical protein
LPGKVNGTAPKAAAAMFLLDFFMRHGYPEAMAILSRKWRS